MADIFAALKNHLATDETIGALVGESIYQAMIPDGKAFPVICMWCASDHPVIGLSGASSNHTSGTYSIDIYAERADTARRLRKAVIDRLNGFTGVMFERAKGDEPAGQITVYSSIYENGRSVEYMDRVKIFGWETEFELSFSE